MGGAGQEGWLRIAAGASEVALDPAIGNIRRFRVRGREIFHTAHWVGTPAAEQADSAVDAGLAGDFLAAPFGSSDLLDDPPHGWSANSPWHVTSRAQDAGSAVLCLTLGARVMGARVTKEVRLRSGESVLYQCHGIADGAGVLPVAHHPMFRLAPGDAITFSPKRAALTAGPPLAARHGLAYPARTADPRVFPAAAGGTRDLTRYPDAGREEDFVTLVEAEGARLGWTALLRRQAGDLLVILKEARILPVTMLWISDGGRDHAPWDGRHAGVLAVEDGVTAGAQGHRAAAEGGSAVAREGVATGLVLAEGRQHRIRHAIAVLDPPEGFGPVTEVVLASGRLVAADAAGRSAATAFAPGFFAI
ncbi:hypothetical protein [Celeribacter indicus]|uniref:Uncharacterized protein n=1 Tax=Celeribacter indicus TaxID=1208324 RepID=A0A0B5DU34_9RHOB|nr:hypothetical protein [Celeribacter indicus]AJE46973.1 hypothetical protein P73_2258 [Celeribacter indicus]SDW77224.1 hypothetical protein SAMN05443573_1072 [Celeribacter indicus]